MKISLHTTTTSIVINILRILLRYHFHILFVLFEIVAFTFIIRHNAFQGSIYYGVTSDICNSVEKNIYSITRYFSLTDVNSQLAIENTALRNKLNALMDSSSMYDYTYETASIINTSFNKTKNYITLNKGRMAGLSVDMGVCAGDAVVGIIAKTSNKFSIVIPLINTNLKISGMLKTNRHYGSLQWDGIDYRYSYLNDIPGHITVNIGDTVVTSGFSAIFPEGKLLGFVDSILDENANFKRIKIKLAHDFKQVGEINIVHNENFDEQQSLEKEFE